MFQPPIYLLLSKFHLFFSLDGTLKKYSVSIYLHIGNIFFLDIRCSLGEVGVQFSGG